MIGETISHYRIEEKLGEGGMGVVYRAKDTRLLRSVALKILPPNLIVDENNRNRFLQEAQTASSLNHPNICIIHDISEESKTNFIVMEFVNGKTLREMLDENGPINEKDVIEITIKICDALKAVHEKKILHRDIKPENIMISKEGYLKVMDFGLAKLATETAETTASVRLNKKFNVHDHLGNKQYSKDVVLSTLSGFIGTVSYMSPEQALGKLVDHRSDIFSLGIMLYELLTGNRPFKGDYNDEVLYQIITQPIKTEIINRQNISPAMKKIIARCLRKDPNDRYNSISELLLELSMIKESSEKVTGKDKFAPSIIKEPERRQMTIMFGEISNYDEILGQTEIEEAALVMNNCFEMISSEVEKHGGNTDKIIGGTILNFFGAPGSIEDSHKDAVNSAIAIRNKLDQFNRDNNLQIPLQIKIGINTGTVIIESIDDDHYRVMGNTVSHASQVKDLGNSDETIVGSLTYKLTNHDFKYKKLESVLLKGKDKHSEVYKLLSIKEKIQRAKVGTNRKIYSVMVGREKEFAKLKLHVAKLLNGVGSIVSVVGEAGIGKSRLIAELKRENEISQVTFLEGRALSNGNNLSFHPLIDIIKNWSGVTEEDSGTIASQKVENLIREIYPENLGEVFPFMATMMGYELKSNYAERVKGIKGDALEKLILKNLREFLAQAASQRPVIFVMEDFHWSDRTSIEFLEMLFKLAKTESILFINVFRPGYKETGERILETLKQRYSEIKTKIHLEALADDQGEILINNLLKTEGFSSKITNLIAKRSGGNPFFIEEVIRSFIDEGIIEVRDNKFYVTEKISSAAIPETINEVIISRIDRLDEETKSLLKKSSVIGRNFFYKIIDEVADIIEDLDDRLAYLKDIQFIKEQKRMNEIEYLFKHALAHEAVYESILIKKRKELHLKTARAIEKVFKERLPQFYGILSFHYSKGENFEKAEDFLIKAGEEALKSSASSEAIEYFKDALNLYIKKSDDSVDIKKKSMLEYYIAIALQNKGRFVESIQYFNSVQAYYGFPFPKSNFILHIVSFLGYLHLVVAVTFPSLKWKKPPNSDVKEKMKFWWDFNNTYGLIEPKRAFLGNLNFWREFTNYDLSEFEDLKINLLGTSGLLSFAGLSSSTSKKILDLFGIKKDQISLREKLWFSLFNQMHKWVSGNWQISSEDDYDNILVQEFLKIGDLTFASLYINQYTLVKIERGEFSAVQEMLAKLIEIGDVFENEYARIIYYSSNSKLYMKWRKFNEAIEQIGLENQIAEKLGDNLITLQSFSFLARVQILSDKITEAEKSLEAARKHFSNDLPPWYKTDYFTSLLNLNLYYLEKSVKSNNSKEVSKYSKKTVATGKAAFKNSAKFAGDRIEITRLMGKYYWLIKKQKKAIKWWEKSIKFGEQSGGKLELSRTFMEVGKRLSAKHSKYKELNNITANEYLDKAKVMFEEMDLRWDLEELGKVK